MLRQEHNELLTRTGPNTPMGAMFRRYWIPALLAEELAENDGPPVRVHASVREAHRLPRHARAPRARSRSSARIAASRCGSAATRNAGCAVRITAGNTT